MNAREEPLLHDIGRSCRRGTMTSSWGVSEKLQVSNVVVKASREMDKWSRPLRSEGVHKANRSLGFSKRPGGVQDDLRYSLRAKGWTSGSCWLSIFAQESTLAYQSGRVV